MTVWIALLRGINVGGANRLAMADLRELVADLGHTGVATYIQSGNVVFSSERSDRSAMSSAISDAIHRRHQLTIPVVLRTVDEVAAIERRHPDADAVDPKWLHVIFLEHAPSNGTADTLDAERFAPDRWLVDASEVYVTYPNGSGRSKLTVDVFERRYATVGTARNLNTIRKLLELAGRRAEA